MSSPLSPTGPKTPLAPLEIQVSPDLGLPVPVGLVLLKLRTDITQAVLLDASRGAVTLGPADDETTATTVLDPSLDFDTTVAGVSIFA